MGQSLFLAIDQSPILFTFVEQDKSKYLLIQYLCHLRKVIHVYTGLATSSCVFKKLVI